MKNERKRTANSAKSRLSWSDLHLHEVMIGDAKRTKAYQQAIQRHIKPGDAVLDMGCGLGILSFFAAKTQCQKIYSIDNADIIHHARAVAKTNNLAGRIQFIKKDISRFRPKEPVDVLIHEQIGGFLWDECAVSHVANIRRRCLRKGATIIPAKIELFFAPTCARSNIDESVAFWSKKQYGIDFSVVTRDLLMRHAQKAFFPSTIRLNSNKTFLATPRKAYTVDFYKEKNIPRRITSDFTINKAGLFRGMCGFFKIHLDERTIVTSEPQRTNTHWGQMFLPSARTIKVSKGVKCSLDLRPHEDPLKWKFQFKIS
jgi:protein arginine N-methyltransferase 1